MINAPLNLESFGVAWHVSSRPNLVNPVVIPLEASNRIVNEIPNVCVSNVEVGLLATLRAVHVNAKSTTAMARQLMVSQNADGPIVFNAC